MSVSRLERDLDQLIQEHGIRDVFAALCRWCHDKGYRTLFTKLNSVFEFYDKNYWSKAKKEIDKL